MSLNFNEKFVSVLIIAFLLTINITYSHSGRTDANGCHTCRTNCEKYGVEYGFYHKHNPIRPCFEEEPEPTPVKTKEEVEDKSTKSELQTTTKETEKSVDNLVIQKTIPTDKNDTITSNVVQTPIEDNRKTSINLWYLIVGILIGFSIGIWFALRSRSKR